MTQTWQQELAAGFKTTEKLCRYLEISDMNTLGFPDFPLRVPIDYVDRIEKGNINDPLLKQILPIVDETISNPEFINDPVGDLNAMAESGVIHKYHNRVLLITTGACAINCRYCFRKNFPYSDFLLSKKKIAQAIRYIENTPNISEVILSGGDPLLLNDQNLFYLMQQLNQINHIKRIRIHSRLPIVLPSRISSHFCKMLQGISKPIIVVIHTNHINELSNSVYNAFSKLKKYNITLLNQSVLLKGINDNPQQLIALSEKLFEFGVMPYYLHLLDKATGTGHFEVKQEAAIVIMDEIKKYLPGYLVPKLVREQAGALNKIIIT